jgi:hypothetical protein
MKNLESMLAENMRRFNTKNLSEDLNLNAAADFAGMILPKIQPGYDFQTAFHTLVSAGSNTINSWRNVHSLVATSKKMVIVVGEMAPPAAVAGQEKYAPMFAAINASGLVVPQGALTMESLLGAVIRYIDGAAVEKGLKTFIQQAKVPQPTQPLTTQSLQAIATKYKAVQLYNSMATSLKIALDIKA